MTVRPTITALDDGLTLVDVHMHGQPEAMAAYVIDGPAPCLVEPGPASSVDTLLHALDALGMDTLATIVVTHVHLDHAGGAWRVAQAYPDAEVVVHTAGARHLADPSRLLASAARIYGEATMDRMWGPVEPISPSRLRVVDEGDAVAIGGGRRLRIMATPGHAKHHMVALDSTAGAMFVGDSVGLSLADPATGARAVRPASPPPEWDTALALHQIERMRALRPRWIAFAHFGPAYDVDAVLDQAAARIRAWDATVREARRRGLDAAATGALLRALAEREWGAAGVPADVVARVHELASYEADAAGMLRHLEVQDRTTA